MANDLVWESLLDNKYTIRVERSGDHTGILSVIEDGEVCITRPVTLLYNAAFGPDVDDVAEWQEWSADYVDAILCKEMPWHDHLNDEYWFQAGVASGKIQIYVMKGRELLAQRSDNAPDGWKWPAGEQYREFIKFAEDVTGVQQER